MNSGTGKDTSATGISDQDVTYNEAVAFQGDMSVSINNSTLDIEAITPESDEKSEDKSFAADFVADAPDVPGNAQSVNRAVFMRNTTGNPSACHLQNTTINVVAGSGSGRQQRRKAREERRSAKRAGNQTHNYAALVRNTGSSTSNVKIVGGSVNICADGTSGGHNEAIGIDGAGNLNVINGTINIGHWHMSFITCIESLCFVGKINRVTGGGVDRDTKDVEE